MANMGEIIMTKKIKISLVFIIIVTLSSNFCYANDKLIENDNVKTEILNIVKDKEGYQCLIEGLLTLPSPKSPEDIVMEYFNENNNLYRLFQEGDDAKHYLCLFKKENDDIEGVVLKYKQVYNGIEVEGSTIIINIDNNGVIRSIVGTIIPELYLNNNLCSPIKITLRDAIEINNREFNNSHESIKILDVKTTIFNDFIIKNSKKVKVVRYSYRVNSVVGFNESIVYVDAINGDIITKVENTKKLIDGSEPTKQIGAVKSTNKFIDEKNFIGQRDSIEFITDGNGINSFGYKKKFKIVGYFKFPDVFNYYLMDKSRNITIYNARNEGTVGQLSDNNFVSGLLHTIPIVSSHFMTFNDSVSVDAISNISMVYDFFSNKFDRKGYDNKNSNINVIIHPGLNYEDSFSIDGDLLVFGDNSPQKGLPFTVGLDTIGHEYTHSIIRSEVDPLSTNETGAINEALSDVFGCLIEFNYKYLTPDWSIGEDIFKGNALRDISNPKRDNRPEQYGEYLDYPSEIDEGGIHANSGIITKTLYLVSEGGNFNSYKIRGIGKDELAKILYNVITKGLTPNCGFQEFAGSCEKTARELYGPKSKEVDSIVNACLATGIKVPESTFDCGFVLDDDTCSLNGIYTDATKSDVISKMGEPICVIQDKSGAGGYDFKYEGFYISFLNDKVKSIVINNGKIPSRKNLKVGDSYLDAMRKHSFNLKDFYNFYLKFNRYFIPKLGGSGMFVDIDRGSNKVLQFGIIKNKDFSICPPLFDEDKKAIGNIGLNSKKNEVIEQYGNSYPTVDSPENNSNYYLMPYNEFYFKINKLTEKVEGIYVNGIDISSSKGLKIDVNLDEFLYKLAGQYSSKEYVLLSKTADYEYRKYFLLDNNYVNLVVYTMVKTDEKGILLDSNVYSYGFESKGE